MLEATAWAIVANSRAFFSVQNGPSLVSPDHILADVDGEDRPARDPGAISALSGRVH